MATVKQTKTFTGSTGNNDEWRWMQEVTEIFEDDYITTNSSKVTVNSYLSRTRSSSNFGGTASCNIKLKNGSGTEIGNRAVNKTFNWPTYIGTDWFLIQSETFTVNHNTDGSQKIVVESMLNTDDFSPNWTYAYGEVTLNTIPRTSKVTCPSFNIGNSTVINIERASNSFTHTLTYQFGSATGTIATKTTSTSVGWTPNADTFHSQIPNNTSGTGTITCKTYSGDTLIGTSAANFTAYVTQANPDVSATIIDTNQTTIALTGDSSKLVRHFSKPKVTISATPKKKATIKSYKTTIADGQSSTSQTTTFPKIDSNGITVSATDSRGWGNSKTYNPAFINYIKLAFTKIDIDRTESTSTTIKASLQGNYFNASFGSEHNQLVMEWRYKLSTSPDWNYQGVITPTISGNTFSFNANLGNEFDNNSDYHFEFFVSDTLMTISTGIVQVTKGTGVVDIYKDKIQFNVDILLKNGKNLGNILYPVGSVYLSTASTNPATLFGGTWTQISGRFLYCTTTSKTTGGSSTTGAASGNTGAASGNTGSTILTINQIPSHTHDVACGWDTSGTAEAIFFNKNNGTNTLSAKAKATGGGQGHTHTLNSHTHTLNSHTHSQSLPPYFTVYAWYRTA